ncbi:MAG: baseplate J/gp47 family protein, partial [Vicinamibacterales bacterium]
LRIRLLDRMRQPPHGGAAADYAMWAKDVAGVTRAWVYPLELGAGTVTVRFVRDDDAGGIIPDAGEVAAVQTYINERRPVTAAVTVVAPVAVPLAFTIEITPDTSAIRAAVQAELEDLLERDAEPGGTILLSQIKVAIGAAAGVDDFVVTVPAGNVAHSTGQIATMGTITWA